MSTSPITLWLRGQLPALVIAFAILATVGVVKWRASLMPENTYVPSNVMPSPNARDYFTDAEAVARDSYVFAYALGKPQNAPPNTSRAEKAVWTSDYHVFTPSEKDKLVDENMPAITKLQEGLNYPYMAPRERSFTAFSLYHQADRRMAQLLVLEGQTRAAHGDWGGAIDADLNAVELGADLPRGATLVGMLFGLDCEEIGRKPAYQAIDHLSASQAKEAARRLAVIDSNEVTPAQTLREEKWFVQDALLGLFRQPSWRSTFVDFGNDSGNAAPSAEFKFQLQMESPRVAYDNHTRYMDALIANAQAPWPIARLAKLPAQPRDPVNQVLLPVFSQAALKQLGNLAMDRLLEAQLALHAYRLDHGRYPSSLADLAPAYLPAVPLDPFSNSQPLRYRLKGGSYVLYSIGPDAVDNGGQPIVDPHRPDDHGYFYMDTNAPGDIVAGANY